MRANRIKIAFRDILSYWSTYPADFSSLTPSSGSVIGLTYDLTKYIENLTGASRQMINDPAFSQLPFYTWSESVSMWVLHEDVKKLVKLVGDRFRNEYGYIGNNSDDDVQEGLVDLFDNFVNIITMTYDKYAALLSEYRSAKTNLIGSVENVIVTEGEGTGKFKDTPQSEINPSSDDYNTNVTHSEASQTTTQNDGRELAIDKLERLRTKYAEIFREWSDEFEILFVESVNYN